MTETPSVTPPIKQNSPDEEKFSLWCLDIFNSVLVLSPTDYETCKLNLFHELSRKSKAGQETAYRDAIQQILAVKHHDHANDFEAFAMCRDIARSAVAKAGQVEEEGKQSLGPKTLDAKWLDPECWDGCQSLKFKHECERLRIALGEKEAVSDHAQAVLQKTFPDIPRVWCAYCGRWSYHKSGYCPIAFQEFVESVGCGKVTGERIERFISTAFHDGWNECRVLSTQGVGEEQELGNEALPASTQATVATQTDSTHRSLSELLPCPFCGDGHLTVSPFELLSEDAVNPVYFVQCDNILCGASGPPDTYDRAEEKWNKRAAPSVVAGVGEHAVGVEKKDSGLPGGELATTHVLRNALQPFARLANKFDVEPYAADYPDDLKLWDNKTITYHNFLTLGDCRRAKEALRLLLSEHRDGSLAAGVSAEKWPHIWREADDLIICKLPGFEEFRISNEAATTMCAQLNEVVHGKRPPPSPQVEQVSAAQESSRDEAPLTSKAEDAQTQNARPVTFVCPHCAAPHELTREIEAIKEEQRCSTSFLQRRFKRGYHHAFAIIKALEALGYVRNIDKVGNCEITEKLLLSSPPNAASADQVSANPRAVQGEWRVAGCTIDISPSRNVNVVYEDVARTLVDEHNASLKDDKDSARLDYLEELISNCPHTQITFCDDPDCEQGATGFMIRVEGCILSETCGETLRQAIDKDKATHSLTPQASEVKCPYCGSFEIRSAASADQPETENHWYCEYCSREWQASEVVEEPEQTFGGTMSRLRKTSRETQKCPNPVPVPK